MALPYFREFGWEPVVLAVLPEFSENLRDDSLLATLPADVEVHRVRALRAGMSRPFGFGNFALRSLPYLRAKGNEILASRKFDLVFFSTSHFPVMPLGPYWRRRFGIPYVLDFQDPWLTDYYRDSGLKPPGGSLKYGLWQMLARALEPRTVRDAAHIVVVSTAYPALFRERYADLNGKPFTVLPFAAAERDLEHAKALQFDHGVFDRRDGLTHWVYAGAAGAIMEKSMRAFFTAINSQVELDPGFAKRLRIHFVGTDYADGSRARKTVEPLANEYGLAEIVQETTDRLPFLTTLKLLLDADALLIFGSDDPSYTASKIFPYVMARKPLLVIVHEKSSAADIIREVQGGLVVTFNVQDSVDQIAKRIVKRLPEFPDENPQTDWKAFEQYTAHRMTERLCEVFTQAS